MATYTVERTSRIPAAPDRVYGIIADYRNGHRQILPPRVFTNLEVERGGVGAGTIIRFEMRVLGRVRRFRSQIYEPEPGRVLEEVDIATGARTAFRVMPVADAVVTSSVRIATTLPRRDGLAGLLERNLTSLLLRRIYKKELQRLAELAS